MLTEEQYEMLGDKIAPLYQELEREVIADIARRVKKTGRFTETAELMAKAMMDTGKSPSVIRKEVMKLLRADDAYKKEVANNTKQYKRDVIHIIRKTVKDAKKLSYVLIADAGDMAFNMDLSLWHHAGKKLTKDSAFVKLVEQMAVTTGDTLKNITKTTGFKGLHGYTSIENAYVNAMDKAIIKMTSGAFSFDRAAEDAVRELAHSGLRKIDYASGRSYQLDTAARMCLRTSSAQLSAKISMHNCDLTDTDLVEVDSHWGARPEHAEWQGKVYSRSGKNKNYPDFKVCRYGEVDGLCGINCRHSFYPFFEGISEPNQWQPEPEPKDYNGKTYDYYQATQKQRQMERDIRATKREIEAAKTLGSDTAELEAKKRKQIKEYYAFSDAMDIRAKDNRLRVVKGSSDITKTKTYKSVRQKQSAHSNNLGKKVYYDEKNSYKIESEKYSANVNKGLSIAAREVAKEGSKTGYEYMRLVNMENGEVVCRHTDKDKSTVGGKTLYEYLKKHPNDKFAFIHNHNTATELSLGDLELMANNKQIIIVAAVRNDGIISLVESNGLHTTDYIPLRYDKQREEYRRKKYGTLVPPEKVSEYSIDIEIFTRDLVIDEFSDGGLKRYE